MKAGLIRTGDLGFNNGKLDEVFILNELKCKVNYLTNASFLLKQYKGFILDAKLNVTSFQTTWHMVCMVHMENMACIPMH